MELIHYTNNGRQYLDVRLPRHHDKILGRVTIAGGIKQAIPWSVVAGARRGELPIGRVASVMYAVMQQSPIAAQAMARAVDESKGYAAGYPNFQCPRDWLAEATDIVSPSFLATRSWTLGSEELERRPWWADKPNTISLLTPPAGAVTEKGPFGPFLISDAPGRKPSRRRPKPSVHRLGLLRIEETLQPHPKVSIRWRLLEH